mgnify:CR=1 FL=1
MEYMAFSRSMKNISDNDLNVKTFVSDRHSSIAKHMREKLPNINHYFDLWHLTKSMYVTLPKSVYNITQLVMLVCCDYIFAGGTEY